MNLADMDSDQIELAGVAVVLIVALIAGCVAWLMELPRKESSNVSVKQETWSEVARRRRHRNHDCSHRSGSSKDRR